VLGVHWSDRVAELVDAASDGGEVPTCGAHAYPLVHVPFEGPVRDEGVVRAATAQNFCPGVADVGVA
jgi:hypothetical protein